MELDKPHLRTNGGELLICFASRLPSSSSSMKISKSILSPGRARDPPPPVSLSTSLSRRLKTSGSIKGGQASPFFPIGGKNKKRGCAFENPEPSSPKVTCIGQVRVKSKKKKKAKQTRSLSRRRSGDVSFRKVNQTGHDVLSTSEENTNVFGRYFQQPECLPHRNQRWVHFPVTICEALRAFGAEFSCLFPCKSSCFSTNQEREKEDQKVNDVGREENRQSSCGAVFARWFVALQDCEGKQGREIELVVGEEEEDERTETTCMRSSRRHVFEDIEIKEDGIEEKNRASICIPPKNALLLMRCRSDPMKMAALNNRFCESPAPKDDEDEDEEDEEEDDPEDNEDANEPKVETERRVSTELENGGNEANLEKGMQENEEEIEMLRHDSVKDEEDSEANFDLVEAYADQEGEENSIQEEIDEEEEEEEERSRLSHSSSTTGNSDDQQNLESDIATVTPLEEEIEEKAEEEFQEGDEENDDPEEEETAIVVQEESKNSQIFSENDEDKKPIILETSKSSNVLPDCLLLMMCEPKLSMEVSKETWVCRTDFIRWLPERQSKKLKAPPSDEEEEPKKKSVGTDSNHGNPPQENETHERRQQQKHLLQPPRSSCSIPAAASMATMIEQKLVNAVGYEPFVLTRCKSEPMRTAAAAAKLAPDSCFWNNRKLEPHRPATLAGAAGVGF